MGTNGNDMQVLGINVVGNNSFAHGHGRLESAVLRAVISYSDDDFIFRNAQFAQPRSGHFGIGFELLDITAGFDGDAGTDDF